MTDPFADAVAKHAQTDLPLDEQAALGKPQHAQLSDEHDRFLSTILRLIDEGQINTLEPMSFIHKDVYDALEPGLRGQTDRAIPNIVSYLEKIIELHHRAEPNHSYEMKDYIESLWLAKQRIEEHADVFIF